MHGESGVDAFPGGDVGLQAVCFKLNLAKAYPGVYVGNVDQRRAKEPLYAKRRPVTCPGVYVGGRQFLLSSN